MKIDKLSVCNYKAFKGECTIAGLTKNLSDRKNIILLGGLNGAGKTSMFEAILLCLYGKKNKTLWPSRGARHENYESYIKSIINNQVKAYEPCPKMWIEISLRDFEHTNILDDNAISIKRSWEIVNNRPIDHFEIFDGQGQVLEIIPEESWENHIEEIIPYETHQFFFFDGEKIQDFIKDEDKYLEKSLSTVLGINLYNTLKQDLEKAKKDIINDVAKGKKLGVEISEKRAELERLELNISDYKQGINDKEEEINKIHDEIESISYETTRVNPKITGNDEKSLAQERNDLEDKKAALKDEMSRFVDLDLIFLLMGDLSLGLLRQLTNERKKIEFDTKEQAIKPKVHSVLHKLFSGEESKPPLQNGQKKFYTEKLANILKNILVEGKDDSERINIIHGLSEQDSNDVTSKIRNLTVNIEPITQVVKELNRINSRLIQINKGSGDLSNPAVAELIEKKGRLKQKEEQLKKEIENLKVGIDTDESKLTALKKEITKKENAVKLTPEKEKQKEYIEQIMKTIDDFSDKFRSTRTTQLEKFSYEMWSKLAHKKDMISKIEIDKKNFSIQLKNSQDQSLDKTKLSAGEKEILALSLIWSLGKLTDLDLPVVIDTPLGRLDREHRESIAQNYFSNVSNQVFLLSTNEEIIRQEYEAIKDSLSKQYIIKHDSNSQTSQIQEGYF